MLQAVASAMQTLARPWRHAADTGLTGHGYPVLFPCLPQACHELPRDPLDGLVESLFAAVDAAVERGLVDPDRLAHERIGLDLFGTSLMETGQGGMGAPPWDDPERYLRNSPLMHVKRVKKVSNNARVAASFACIGPTRHSSRQISALTSKNPITSRVLQPGTHRSPPCRAHPRQAASAATARPSCRGGGGWPPMRR